MTLLSVGLVVRVQFHPDFLSSCCQNIAREPNFYAGITRKWIQRRLKFVSVNMISSGRVLHNVSASCRAVKPTGEKNLTSDPIEAINKTGRYRGLFQGCQIKSELSLVSLGKDVKLIFVLVFLLLIYYTAANMWVGGGGGWVCFNPNSCTVFDGIQ